MGRSQMWSGSDISTYFSLIFALWRHGLRLTGVPTRRHVAADNSNRHIIAADWVIELTRSFAEDANSSRCASPFEVRS